MSANDARPGSVVGDRFVIDTRLGAGGFGSVWSALDKNTNAKVALKILHPEVLERPDLLDRFVREGRLLQSLDHPAIARAIECRADETQAYLAMELVLGTTLEDALRGRAHRGAHFLRQELLTLFRPICEAVDFAHGRGIVHRDLKPSNVMLMRTSVEPRVKLLDFGIARLLFETEEKQTTHGRVMGSLYYMSPEQICGEPVGPASDLFALGVLLFETITLKRAWVRAPTGEPARAFVDPIRQIRLNEPGEVIARISGCEYPLPSTLRPDLVGLDALFERALAPDPGARFPNAVAMSSALAHALTDRADSSVETRIHEISLGPDSPSSSQPDAPTVARTQLRPEPEDPTPTDRTAFPSSKDTRLPASEPMDPRPPDGAESVRSDAGFDNAPTKTRGDERARRIGITPLIVLFVALLAGVIIGVAVQSGDPRETTQSVSRAPLEPLPSPPPLETVSTPVAQGAHLEEPVGTPLHVPQLLPDAVDVLVKPAPIPRAAPARVEAPVPPPIAAPISPPTSEPGVPREARSTGAQRKAKPVRPSPPATVKTPSEEPTPEALRPTSKLRVLLASLRSGDPTASGSLDAAIRRAAEGVTDIGVRARILRLSESGFTLSDPRSFEQAIADLEAQER